MNSLDALRRMVATYPGGRAAIAARLGKSEEVLRKELSGTSAHHKIGLADAEQIAEMCHEVGSSEACALGTVFSFKAGMLTLPVVDSAETLCLSRTTAHAVHETADVLLAVTKSKADGNISDNDKKEVLREVTEAAAALQAVMRALKAEHARDNAGRL
ncbi:phage regulatory CII family protein [Comamonas kerstersii]|uniref:phage regulatory CII family protein n=1 Tax=Comamonas kerstersii TaxID=225992 RepID=UPI001B32AA8A|nr:phage regulatory CII family protein [Comamonas kerstersii]QTW20222.1 transcriptional regulator [Comamonas kerstersii]